MEHEGKALDEKMEGPLLESIALALTVSTTLDHRPARVPQVTVEPLLAQHCNECGKQGDQKTRVHESSDSDDLAGRVLGGWNGGGFVRDSGFIESEEDRAEKSCRLFVRVRLELRMDVDDEGRADGREETGLRERSDGLREQGDRQHTKISVVLRSSSYFLT